MPESSQTSWVDINLERQIVATMLAGITTFDPTLVKTDYFTHQALRTIWQWSFAEWVAGKKLDVVIISGALSLAGVLDAVGGDIFLTKLVTWLPSAATDKHCKALENLWQRRMTQNAIMTAAKDLESGSVPVRDIISTFDTKTMIAVGENNNSYANKNEELDDAAFQIMHPNQQECIPTPWPSLDKFIGGLRPQELVIVAGRPGMGKTGLMVTAQRVLAKDNIPTLAFSLDMGKRQLWNRYISQESVVPVSNLENGSPLDDATHKKILDSVEAIKQMPLWIDSNPYRTLAEIRMIVRQHVAKYGTKVIFLDHVGKIRPEKANSREQEVSIIAQGLKALTKEFDVNVFLLAQLNRNVEMRADKRPMLSDLRESGTLEQEADIILLAYRPEYYDLTTFTDGTTASTGRMELIVGKARNGGTGSTILDFQGEYTFIGEPDHTKAFAVAEKARWEYDENQVHIQPFN